jgi:hypothetical protein
MGPVRSCKTDWGPQSVLPLATYDPFAMESWVRQKVHGSLETQALDRFDSSDRCLEWTVDPRIRSSLGKRHTILVPPTMLTLRMMQLLLILLVP